MRKRTQFFKPLQAVAALAFMLQVAKGPDPIEQPLAPIAVFVVRNLDFPWQVTKPGVIAITIKPVAQ